MEVVKKLMKPFGFIRAEVGEGISGEAGNRLLLSTSGRSTSSPGMVTIQGSPKSVRS